ncbi:MAG: hypothetical protein AB1634_13685 [Thermodesulfobacteriota bacterium]
MGIAVLLTGNQADRHAVDHAVSLARRTDDTVFGLRDRRPAAAGQETSLGHSLAILLREADACGVAVECHDLPVEEERELIAFLRQHRIRCLVVGADDRSEERRVGRWLEDVRRAIARDQDWAMRSFWTMIAVPGGTSTTASGDRAPPVPDG